MRAIVFANFLAPTLYKTYQYIVEYIERQIAVPCFLASGESEEDFLTGAIDGGFVCGLFYVHLARMQSSSVEVIAAPILTGERYQRKPIYYSDIIVHKDSPIHSFEELRGHSWAYNETASHSGYNLIHATLLERGYPAPAEYFGHLIKSGSHGQSLRMVLNRAADVSAIDSHMLDVVVRNNPQLMDQLRIIDTFGPSSIPPVVLSRRLAPDLKKQIKEALFTIHTDQVFAQHLREGQIERFVPIADQQYNDIRGMYDRVQASIHTRIP